MTQVLPLLENRIEDVFEELQEEARQHPWARRFIQKMLENSDENAQDQADAWAVISQKSFRRRLWTLLSTRWPKKPGKLQDLRYLRLDETVKKIEGKSKQTTFE